ncbi:hypothetical protein BDP27DRAFT_1299738 [Rhodocollybia butyracea]|uniref:FIST domain-containing protein n=1 Tax=Rhodocollybia butyracea TaxID=206335 RepID=A0A9P5PIK1_9AGAR|nr:hypothetical protein BDP27DRAFT_1299738 [Rhodocollybia butyracea]
MFFSATITSRSSTSIISRLSQIKAQHASKPHVLLFALSSPTPSDSSKSELSALVDTLLTFSSSSESVGCLSAPLIPGSISCSIALFDPQNVVTFRSTIAGKEKVQVGRWHALRKRYDTIQHGENMELDTMEKALSNGGPVDWDNLWKAKTKETRGLLPRGLTSYLNSPTRANGESSVLYFSDLSPEGLSSSIPEAFPRANQLGLLASSTPFVTGRPVTLFHNQEIYDTGAVGVAFENSKPMGFALPRDVEPLGEALSVTDSEGNLINTLNSSNPTQLLLSCIRAAGIDAASYETEFLLGVLPRTGSLSYQLHAITAGDPSRGTLSLNAQTMAPVVGSRVQFYHRIRKPETSSLLSPGSSMSFTVVSPEHSSSERSELVLENRFVAASDNGFVLGRTGETPWSCIVPGCVSQIK